VVVGPARVWAGVLRLTRASVHRACGGLCVLTMVVRPTTLAFSGEGRPTKMVKRTTGAARSRGRRPRRRGPKMNGRRKLTGLHPLQRLVGLRADAFLLLDRSFIADGPPGAPLPIVNLSSFCKGTVAAALSATTGHGRHLNGIIDRDYYARDQVDSGQQKLTQSGHQKLTHPRVIGSVPS
jgi:hypothetical protein